MEAPWKHFKTLNMEHSELSEDENERTLWYLSDKMMDYYESGGSVNILDYLNNCLIDNMDYYVFHDVKTYKGKKIVKAGRIVISRKSSILKFVEQDRDQDGYSTPIRIMPRIAPSFVLKIHEGDGISHFSNRSANNYLVINDIRVSESEIYVGVTDARRWFSDLKDGYSGSDAMTLAAIIISDTKSGIPRETADLTSTIESEFRSLIFNSLANISSIAWDIRNKQMNIEAAKNHYFGLRIKEHH